MLHPLNSPYFRLFDCTAVISSDVIVSIVDRDMASLENYMGAGADPNMCDQ